jgi:hypothetical protein
MSEACDAKVIGWPYQGTPVTFGRPSDFHANGLQSTLNRMALGLLVRLTEIKQEVSQFFEPRRSHISERTFD